MIADTKTVMIIVLVTDCFENSIFRKYDIVLL